MQQLQLRCTWRYLFQLFTFFNSPMQAIILELVEKGQMARAEVVISFIKAWRVVNCGKFRCCTHYDQRWQQRPPSHRQKLLPCNRPPLSLVTHYGARVPNHRVEEIAETLPSRAKFAKLCWNDCGACRAG